MFSDDAEHPDEFHAWPSFVDLLAATVLLLLSLIVVVIIVVTPGNDGLQTWRSRLVAELRAQPAHGRIFEIDTSDALWVGVILRAEATFPVGRFEFDKLTADGRDALDGMVKTLNADSVRHLVREIRIIGHTDATPYRNPANAFSNWELSAARAAAVARYLVTRDSVYPCLVNAVGKGSHYPREPQRAPSRDRRIEIQIVPALQDRAAPEYCDPKGDGTALFGSAGGVRVRDTAIERIRAIVAEINVDRGYTVITRVISVDPDDTSVEGYLEGTELRKIVVRRPLHLPALTEQYFLWDGEVVFVLRQSQSSAQTELGANEAEEERFYFRSGRLLMSDGTDIIDDEEAVTQLLTNARNFAQLFPARQH